MAPDREPHDDRIRVLWLVKGLGPGGAEKLLHSVARMADHQTFRYEVAYLLSWKAALVPSLEAAGVRCRCLNVTRAHNPMWLLRLRRLLRQENYDVLHMHSPLVAGLARLLVRTLPRSQRPRKVTTEHNEWSGYAWGTRLVNAMLYGTDDACFAVSDHVRGSVSPKFRDRVEVLVHGLVLEDFEVAPEHRAHVRRDLGVPDDEILVVTVANFRTQKAYPVLLEAARRAVEECPRIRFVAIGQGPLEQEIRDLHARLGLGDRFEMLGYRSDVLQLLAASDIFTLASTYEGYPIAVMEALAAGVPLVVTRVGGVPQAISDGIHGRIVPTGRPDLLADGILELALDDGFRTRCAANALQRGQDFDIRTAVDRIQREYRALSTAHRGH